MNRSVTVVYPKENVGVGLSRYRFGSDQGAPQQWEPGCFVSGTMITAREQQAWMWEISTPTIEGGGKQKPKQGFPESGILLTSCANTSIPDVPSVWYLE